MVTRILALPCLLWLTSGCARPTIAPVQRAESRVSSSAPAFDPVARSRIMPVSAHHQHLIGPAYLATWHTAPMTASALPPVLDAVLRGHRALIGRAVTDAYKEVYAPTARLLLPEQIVNGAPAIAKSWSAYRTDGFVRYVVPTSFELRDDHGSIIGIMVESRPDSSTRYAWRLMHMLINVQKNTEGKWLIVTESATPMNRAPSVDTITARSLIDQMDEAGVTHGILAALGYEFAEGPEVAGEQVGVQAENDWNVRQAAQFPGRLVVFCGLNPIRSYAIAEMDRCAKLPGVRGMKLYVPNRVDLSKPADVEKMRQFFSAANERRMPILIHLSVLNADGARHARIFLEQIVPAAPDIPIQIAHMAGGNWFRLGAPDAALKVFADAAAAGSPLMKNLYFDQTGSVYGTEPATTYDTLAVRMRTIGLNRILFGSDLPFYPQEKVSGAWAAFRRFMPLTNDELRIIAGNVGPYSR